MPVRYKVKSGFSCSHAGVEYSEGEFLPENLSIEDLNVHLLSVEMVEEREDDSVEEQNPPPYIPSVQVPKKNAPDYEEMG